MSTRVPRFIGSLTAVSVLAACSTSATSTPPSQPPAHAASRMVASARATERFGISAQTVAQARASRGAGSWANPDKKVSTLFVADLNGAQIRIYSAKAKDPMQSGSITTGIDLPINVAADKHGTVYVANNGNNTVTEYPFGATSPSVTLSTDIVYPNGIAVDAKGTVYVTSGSTVGQCYVLEFAPGATSPTAIVNGFGLPIGLAIDKNDNLYVADATADKVWEVPKGSTTPQDLGLTGLDDDTGLAIDGADDLYVANYAANAVPAYHLGQTSPFVTISDGVTEPYALGFTKKSTLFVGNYRGYVTAYKSGQTAPWESFSNGIISPTGIALYPGTTF